MWEDRRVDDSQVEIEIDDNHQFFSSPPNRYTLLDGELIRDEEYVLALAKKKKDKELNDACNKSIKKGFYHMVNGTKYHFSYDTEAQINFGDSKQVLNDGLVETVDWTVSIDGVYTRIPITKGDIDRLTVSIFAHKQENIKRYREELLPLVSGAKTVEEVNEITWELKETIANNL